MNNKSCPIWGTPAEFYPTRRDGDDVDSPRAGGRHFISRTAMVNVRQEDEITKSRITTWLIDQRNFGLECPEVLSDVVEDAKSLPSLSVHERADRLLKCLQIHSPCIGVDIIISKLSHDVTSRNLLAWSESIIDEELIFLLKYLDEQKWIDIVDRPPVDQRIKVLVDGYAHLAEIENKVTNSSQAFVAMWFDDSMKDIYKNAIEPAIEAAGYKAMRIDRKDHNNKIDDEIIAEIRRSRFIVADFTHGGTGMRGGVYYEAGFARGLGLEVVSTCQKELLDNSEIHFDTRQYNHIGWEKDKIEDFRTALSNRISATIGDGPLRKTK